MTQTKFWDSVEGRYVERSYDAASAMETFGELADGAPMWMGRGTDYEHIWTSPLPVAYDHTFANEVVAANDNAPVARQQERRGDWMQTYTGRQFWPLDPRADEVFIEDIAHSLSMQCRYAGHCRRFYSVAEHSVHLARHFIGDPGLALWALLHDASEAYLVDVPRPVKPYLAGYKDAERAVMAAICDRFGLPATMPAEVHAADSRIIGDERANMMPCVAEWYATGEGLGIELKCWPPYQAEEEFLSAFYALRDMRDMEIAA